MRITVKVNEFMAKLDSDELCAAVTAEIRCMSGQAEEHRGKSTLLLSEHHPPGLSAQNKRNLQQLQYSFMFYMK